MQIKTIKIDASNYNLVIHLFDQYRIFYKQPSNLVLAADFIMNRVLKNESVIFIAQNSLDEPIGFTQLYPIFSSVSASKN